MEKNQPKHPKFLKLGLYQSVSRWLPIIMIAVALALSGITWHDLTVDPSDRFLYTLSENNQHWVILIVGILLAILIAAAIRLIQLSNHYDELLIQIQNDFNQEITEHLKAEETKKKLEIALLEGQKLQAIGTLAGGIAHDFNNILYAINGYVEMARDDIKDNTIAYNNLGRVLEASKRGQDLVARILAFGRRNQQYEQKAIQLNNILENVLALLRPTIPSSVTIELTGVENTCMILGNQTQLHQVIVNIINNAVDAMYGEGHISIHVSKIVANDPYLDEFPKIDRNRSYCKIDIIDTGHGMDQATLQRIFEPFYTTKEVGKGTGLGLASAHGIIEQHHGEISVTSQLGSGTNFTLLLPEYQQVPTEVEEDLYGDYSFSGR